MLVNKLFIFFVLPFLLVNCTSKSAQAKLRSENIGPIHKVKSIKDKMDDSIKPNDFFLYPTFTTNQIIKHNYFTVSYSDKDEQPEWVAYKVSSENYTGKMTRTNDYREDPFVKTKSASPNDYHGNGYDMGHMAPAHAMTYNLTSMSESFYLSNISPQKASFNRGIWRSLEGKVEYWSSFQDSIYVVTGPIIDNPIGHIGKNEVTVPRAFYKTLLAFNNGKIKAIAFIIPNEKSNKNIYSYAVSIDSVETVTGIDFYYELDKITQDSLEAKKDVKSWILINQ